MRRREFIGILGGSAAHGHLLPMRSSPGWREGRDISFKVRWGLTLRGGTGGSETGRDRRH